MLHGGFSPSQYSDNINRKLSAVNTVNAKSNEYNRQFQSQTFPPEKSPARQSRWYRGGEDVLTRCYGQRDVEANLPVTPARQFPICSITKSVTAAVLALLHRVGSTGALLGAHYMPEFRLSDPVAAERISVLDLLCHRTGLPHNRVHEPGDRGLAEIVGVVRHLQLKPRCPGGLSIQQPLLPWCGRSSNAGAGKTMRRPSARA
jgi:Beta-lactamase